MGNIWIREFTGGLDARRLPEASAGGTLIRADNCHITRGGEIEQRAAFVPFATAPAGTVGLAHSTDSIVIFGHLAEGSLPLPVPAGLVYQRLIHPDAPATALTRIRSWDLYAGKLYVAAEFADGEVFHFYDGTHVDFWFDGKARAQFDVLSGVGSAGAAAAHCTLEVLNVISFPAQIDNIFINGVDLLSAPITYNPGGLPTITDSTLLAIVIDTAINANSGTSGWASVVSGTLLTITATDTGPDNNGVTINPIWDVAAIELNGTMVIGGADAVPLHITSVTIDTIESLSAPVAWAGSAVATATALAAAMDANSGATGFDATSEGPTVYVAAQAAGLAENGKFVQIIADAGYTFSSTLIATSGAVEGDVQPGAFVKTVGKKMYSTAGSALYFSGIGAPTQWRTNTVGAGFIDMSTESSGSEDLLAVARYQQLLAIFSETVIQMWYVDPDPALNRQTQLLNNTGTISGASVTQFGDNDLFYLDESGVRSLRARDSSNSAATTDIGTPIDPLIIEKLQTMSDDDRSYIIGLIEPQDGRFWLTMRDEIYVFSFFNGSKVSAWSKYLPTYYAGDAIAQLQITYATTFQKRVYVRDINRIFTYGGTGPTQTYDRTPAVAWLPYLDANDPSREKQFTAIDAAVRGQWLVRAGLDPNDITVEQDVARLFRTSFGEGGIPAPISGHHISLRFRSEGVGPHTLSSALIVFDGTPDED